jgi:hypothetical protein
MTRTQTALLSVLPAVALSVLLSGCGSKDQPAASGNKTPGGGANASADGDFDKRVKFARCMRENGVEMKDPEPQGADGQDQQTMEISDPARFQAALPKCRSLLPNGGAVKMTPEELERQRKFAKCMRDNGIADFPDPDPDGGAVQAGHQADDKFLKANETCSAKVGDSGKK